MFDTFQTVPKSAWESGPNRQALIVKCGARYAPIRDRQDRHETPSGVKYNEPAEAKWSGSLVDKRGLHEFHQVPDNEFEALMVCAPGEDPKLDQDQAEGIGGMIESMLEILSPKERSVIELVVIGQQSLSEAGLLLAREYGRSRSYSKALVAKYRDSALEKLRKVSEETV